MPHRPKMFGMCGVGMEMQRHIQAGREGRNQLRRGHRRQESRHVLDGERSGPDVREVVRPAAPAGLSPVGAAPAVAATTAVSWAAQLQSFVWVPAFVPIVAVVPLLALSQLGTAQRVSVFYFALSAVGLAMISSDDAIDPKWIEAGTWEIEIAGTLLSESMSTLDPEEIVHFAREHSLPEDVATLARPVLGHRLLLDSSAAFSGVTADEVVDRSGVLAELDDGLFDVVTIDALGLLRALPKLARLYSGGILRDGADARAEAGQ